MQTERVYRIPVGGRDLDLPCFIPSVSSLKTNLRPEHYLQLLAITPASQLLVSAYDISHSDDLIQQEMEQLMIDARERGSLAFLDSGNYEAYWRSDASWTVEQFHSVVKMRTFDMAFCYDNQTPQESVASIVECTVRSVLRDQDETDCTVIPILHGRPDRLPDAARRVAEQLCPLLLAIPERELGDGIINRLRTVIAIRKALDDLQLYVPVHLLGTGHPLSILLYAAAGADSFDGLEWCQTVVDHATCSLLHFQHWDRVRTQTQWGDEESLPYDQSALLHNLEFYTWFMRQVRGALMENALERFAGRYFSPEEADFTLLALRESKGKC